MELEELYKLAEKEKIEIHENCPIEKCKGLVIQQNGLTVIVLNKKEISTFAEEKCVLAEEMRSLFLRCYIFTRC